MGDALEKGARAWSEIEKPITSSEMSLTVTPSRAWPANQRKCQARRA